MNGKVYLVGAGPGDPELLTLKALNLLRQADAVLHDDLVSPEILGMASAKALRYDVGKRSGQKSTRQGAIHFLMIELARQGLVVVRLKGGDPMIFGRGGEEIQALRQAGIEFEVVPGVTSALAAAAAAEISLTMRDTASSLLIMTGHFAKDDGNHPLPDLRTLLAAGTTIALYMPGSEPNVTVNKLVAAGLGRHTPCAVISRATTPNQQVAVMTLGALGNTRTHAKPSMLIIGDVARLSRYDEVRLNDVFSQPFPRQAEIAPQPRNGVANHG